MNYNNNSTENNGFSHKKFCLYYFTYIDSCIDTSCPLYPCKFSDIHKTMTSMFKSKYNLSTNDSRRITRGILLNTYKPDKRELTNEETKLKKPKLDTFGFSSINEPVNDKNIKEKKLDAFGFPVNSHSSII